MTPCCRLRDPAYPRFFYYLWVRNEAVCHCYIITDVADRYHVSVRLYLKVDFLSDFVTCIANREADASEVDMCISAEVVCLSFLAHRSHVCVLFNSHGIQPSPCEVSTLRLNTPLHRLRLVICRER